MSYCAYLKYARSFWAEQPSAASWLRVLLLELLLAMELHQMMDQREGQCAVGKSSAPILSCSFPLDWCQMVCVFKHFNKFRWRSSHLKTKKQLARCRCLLLDHFAAQNLHLPSWSAGVWDSWAYKTCLTWQTWLELTLHYKCMCTIWSDRIQTFWLDLDEPERKPWCGLAWGKGMLCSVYGKWLSWMLGAWGGTSPSSSDSSARGSIAILHAKQLIPIDCWLFGLVCGYHAKAKDGIIPCWNSFVIPHRIKTTDGHCAECSKLQK